MIGLNLIPQITPRRMIGLLDRFTSPRAIWRATARELAEAGNVSRSAAEKIVAARSKRSLDCELSQAKELNVQIVTLVDDCYPPALREIPAPPVVLYIKGEVKLGMHRAIAIVGTRKSSGYGRAMARKLAAGLGELGVAIVSGLAAGIDTAAHKGALKAEAHTIAVLGSGLVHLYPAENRRLARKIGGQGALISEYPLNMKPARWTFPQRNRIVSGLCRGVIVVEAPERSGALITARCALDQGREVFAVPGNVTSTSSAGTNRLIKDGAKLVEGVDDVTEEFADWGELQRESITKAKSSEQMTGDNRRVYELIGVEPVHIDDIIAKGNLSPTEASQVLLELQLQDLIQEVEGRRYIRSP